MKPAAAPPRRTAPRARGLNRGAVFRLCRAVPGYLSALAFLALIFFAGTGLLLNHPDWLQVRVPAPRDSHARLEPEALTAALRAPEPDRALAAAAGRRTPLLGAYKDASVDGQAHLIRLEGARGSTDLTVDARTGAVDAVVQRATAVNVVEELHRGRAAGSAWRWVIDVSAVVILLLSVVGYVLFFSLRFRLRTSLLLTAASLLALLAVFVFATP